ncbi:hypothetical protein RUM43_000536 [Polyplax serrata]|uniref:Uncharacterized protein n=1 Tax=Polyplax serrata TaxID=468196 RepID=A0AAN8SE38_POLSC
MQRDEVNDMKRDFMGEDFKSCWWLLARFDEFESCEGLLRKLESERGRKANFKGFAVDAREALREYAKGSET